MKMRTRYIVLDWVGKWVVWRDWPDGTLAIGTTPAEAFDCVKRAYSRYEDGRWILVEEDWAAAEQRLCVVEIPWPDDESDPRLSDPDGAER
jgi:hypothetical protein